MGGGGHSSSAGFDDLGAIFEEMFSGFGGARRRQNPADMEKYPLDMNIDMYISFQEAIFGCEKEIEYSYKKACIACRGTGAKDGKLSTCPQCKGQGQVYMKQGFMTFSQTCPVCHGTGSSATEKCSNCKGLGYEEVKEKITISVPKGIDSGNRLRVSGKGNIGKNGRRGDLYITFEVKPDKQRYTFRGEGIEDVHGHGKGDLITIVDIQYPKKLNDEQLELLDKLQDSFGIESKPHEGVLDSVIDKMKSWFK